MKLPQDLSPGALRSAFALIGLLLLLVAAMATKGLLVALPDAPEVAAQGEFDSHRAAARLARVLGDERPHPVDSDAGDSVTPRRQTSIRMHHGCQPSLA